MKQKSWQLDRRTILKGAGATLALPLLNSMLWGKESTVSKKRFCSIYFPHGVPTPKEGSKNEKWNWYPKEESGNYEFREILKSLEDVKKNVIVLQGLSHINCRKVGGHETGDSFLTGTPISKGKYKNTISVDQVLAGKYGDQTRFNSLVLGTEGGIGQPTRSNTLSYNAKGLPIPAQSNLRRIFNRMFSVASQKETVSVLKNKKSILDDVLSSSKDLKRKLGKQDQSKLDEYLSAIRQLEKRIQKEEAWLGKPLPKVDEKHLSLKATYKDPENYIKSMYDLMFLAFQTDTTRYATFQLACQSGAISVGGRFPLSLGGKRSHHKLAHSMNKDNGAESYGLYLQFLTKHYAAFLEKLQGTTEGAVTMLDNTVSLYGTSNSQTHSTINYPLILAGGAALGIKQGQYLKFGQDVPLANMYLTILDKLGAPQKSFVDSDGPLKSLLKV